MLQCILRCPAVETAPKRANNLPPAVRTMLEIRSTATEHDWVDIVTPGLGSQCDRAWGLGEVLPFNAIAKLQASTTTVPHHLCSSCFLARGLWWPTVWSHACSQKVPA